MATRNPIQPQAAQASQLCDYCHLKPKFGGHAYCSKTCGTQAATLCNYCHKKPKFQNFEYCGKACAGLANPGGIPKPAGRGPPGGNGNAPRGKGPQNAAQNPPPYSLDPVQIAKLVMQQMPQVQGLLNPGGPPYQNGNSGGYGAHQPQNPSMTAPQNNNPFMNPAPQTGPMSNGIPHFSSSNNGVNYGTLLSSGDPGQQQQLDDAENLECLIPGCGKPVHVDAQGLKTSDYCSQRHREEAVATGLVSPCIMCLTKPQSHTDYFCGRGCREESLNKHYEVSMAAGLGQQDEEPEEQ